MTVLLLTGLFPYQQLTAQTQISPPDGFVISYPMSISFKWNPLGQPTKSYDYVYTLSLYKVEKNQTISQAIAKNTPLFAKTFLNKTGHSYSFNNTYVEKTQLVWRVCGKKQSKIKGGQIYKWVCSNPSTMHALMTPPPPVNCFNGGLEENDFSGWTGATGTYGNVNTPGFVNNRHTIMAGSSIVNGNVVINYDPNVQNPNNPDIIPITPPNGGDYSFQLGNDDDNHESESATFDFIVDASTATFYYNYAIVLEDPGHSHSANEHPYFSIEFYTIDVGGNEVPISSYVESTHNHNEYYKYTDSGIAYKNWDCHVEDLSSYMGEQVFVRFTTADCNLGAHYGYAYIDMLCSQPYDNQPNPVIIMDNEYCIDEIIYADFSQTTLANEYTLTILDHHLDYEFTHTLQDPVDQLNITLFYKKHSPHPWACGHEYEITLTAANDCTNSVSTSHTFSIDCPTPNVTPNQVYCEDNIPSGISIGGAAIPGATYSWTPAVLLDDPTSANPTVTFLWQGNHTFDVTVTSVNGCIGTESVNINVVQNPTVSISMTEDFCLYHLTANVSNPSNVTPIITWTNQNTGATYNGYSLDVSKEDPDATYSVDVGFGGSSCAFDQIDLQQDLYYYHVFEESDLVIPNAFTPNGTNNLWNIIDVIDYPNNPSTGTGPAYHATEAIVEIYNRWGDLVFEQDLIAPPGGFLAGDLGGWDGNFNGAPQPMDVYVYYIKLKNCNGVWTDPLNDMWKGNITLIR